MTRTARSLVRDQTEAIVAAVDELRAETPGDVLVFLPGEREIRDTADALSKKAEGPRGFDVVPLYSRLSAAEQHRVFERHTRRRVVLATNVAETSLTVPGHHGRGRHRRGPDQPLLRRAPRCSDCRSSRSARPRPTSAPVAAGGSRQGSRSGSTPRRTTAARPEFTEPEILRTTLASVILQMTSLGLGDIDAIPVRRSAGRAQRPRRGAAARGARCAEGAARGGPVASRA